MTPELREFRKWGVVAGLIERFTENQMEPVVLNADGIAMLIIHGDRAFFFFSSSDSEEIIVNTWMADTGEKISSGPLFPTRIPDCVTFREIAHLAIAKTLSQ